ncbi:hypothetical protein D3C81_1823650 [compost metagenome]
MATLHLQLPEQQIKILCHIINMIAGLRLIRVAMPAEVRRDDAVPLCKLRENAVPHMQIASAEMEE